MWQAIAVVLLLFVGAIALMLLAAIAYFIVMAHRHEKRMRGDTDDDDIRPL